MKKLGRYDIRGNIGGGGMGDILLGYDPNLGRQVAIKILKIEGEEHQVAILKERFRREARNAAQLSHPNIVTIHDFEADRDPFYIVMELIDGQNLRQLVRRDRKLPFAERLRILKQTAAALDYAHSRNVIHRDVKPENIMIREDGMVKLTDFGIAKSLGSAPAKTLTEAGTMAGTPHYVPPEAIEGQTWAAKGDQFSFAVVAYELLAGRKPFQGRHLYALFDRIKNHPLPAPEVGQGQFPYAAYEVFLTACAKQPGDRFPACGAFIDALEGSLSGFDEPGWIQALQDEIAHWERVKKTFETKVLRDFLARHPSSEFGIEAEDRLLELQLEDESWATVLQDLRAETLEEFLRRFPFGGHAETAKRKLAALGREHAAWDEVRQSDLLEPLREFIENFPEGRYEAEARHRLAELQAELAAWQAAQSRDDVQAYRVYLKQYPAGSHVKEADGRLAVLEAENREWLRIRDSFEPGVFQRYLDEHPRGAYRNAALSRLDHLRAEAFAWVQASGNREGAALGVYLTQFPTGRHAAEASAILEQIRRESAAWETTRAAGRLEDFERFVTQHANSRYAAEARDKIKALQADLAVRQELARSYPDREALAYYVEQFPSGQHALQATGIIGWIDAEERAWQAVNPDDPLSLAVFVEVHPAGRHAKEASNRLAELQRLKEESDWQALQRESPTRSAFERFLQQHPAGTHTKRAMVIRQRLEEEWQAWQKLDLGNQEALEGFIRQFAGGEFAGLAELNLDRVRKEREQQAAEARERLARIAADHTAWQGAENEEAALKAYIEQFPEGLHRAEADDQLAAIGHEREQWTRIDLGRAGEQTAQDLREFLRQFPQSRYAAEARLWLDAWERDEQAWRETDRESEASLLAYSEAFPNGGHQAEARQRIDEVHRVRDEQAWRETDHESEPALLTYCEAFPNGGHQAEARRRIDEVRRLREAQRIAAERERDQQAWRETDHESEPALLTYCEAFPNGGHQAEARQRIDEVRRLREAQRIAAERERDEQAWRETDRESEASLLAYCEAFPRGGRLAEARQRIDEVRRLREERRIAAERERDEQAWRETDRESEASLLAYCEAFPNGGHQAEARQRIDEIRRLREEQRIAEEHERERQRLLQLEKDAFARARSGGAAQCRQFLQQFPESKFAPEVRVWLREMEEKAWQSSGDTTALTWFLREFPDGEHAGDARRQLQKHRRRTWVRFGSAAATLAALVVLVLSVPIPRRSPKQDPTPPSPLPKLAPTPAPTPDPSRQLAAQEAQDWLKAPRADVDALRKFLSSYPAGAHAAEAKSRITLLEEEMERWEEIKSTTDPNAVQQFSRKYPDGRYSSEARNLLARLEGEEKTWAEAVRKRDVPSLDAYLRTFPNASHRDEAQKMRVALINAAESAYQGALASNDPAAMEKYLRENPASAHVADGRAKIAEWTMQREWARVKAQPGVVLIESFRNRYPGNPYEAEAARMIDEIQSEELWTKLKDSTQVNDLDQYVRRYPNSPRRKAAEDRVQMIRDWGATQSSRSAEAIRRYLDRFPSSPFESEARKLLDAINREEAASRAIVEKKAPPLAPPATRSAKDGLIYVRIPDATQAFYLGRTEVTVGAYRKFASETGTQMPNSVPWNPRWASEDLPVSNLSAASAVKYCTWIGGRLPTENEWLVAARGGSETAYVSGDSASQQYSNFRSDKPLPVASLKPNALGVFDLTGNVSEYVYDGSRHGTENVALRGGTFSNGANEMRLTYRRPWKFTDPASGTGFRCRLQ